jgi:signal transduction histidine kinase
MNLITNLIDNAVKYSKENLLIRITTHSTPKASSSGSKTMASG